MMTTIENSKYREKETYEANAVSENPFEKLLVARDKVAVGVISKELLIKLANDPEQSIRLAIRNNSTAQTRLSSGRKRELFDAGFSLRKPVK